jgi:hypothetical protein
MNPDAIAVFIPVSAIVMGGLVLIAKYFTQARRQGGSEAVEARLDALEHALTSVQNELGETQERLDFAERLLAQSREDKRLDAPG